MTPSEPRPQPQPQTHVPVLGMQGDMDVETVKPFAAEVRRSLRVRGGALVVDMSRLGSLTGGAMGELLLLQSEAERRGGSIKLAAVPDDIEATLHSNGMTGVFDLYESAEAAVRSFLPRRAQKNVRRSPAA